MALTVEWSPQAIDDLALIAEYISRDSEFYAKAIVQKILLKSRQLSDFPESGRIVPELADSCIREQFVYSYRLIYQLKQHSIMIVAIIHGKRDPRIFSTYKHDE